MHLLPVTRPRGNHPDVSEASATDRVIDKMGVLPRGTHAEADRRRRGTAQEPDESPEENGGQRTPAPAQEGRMYKQRAGSAQGLTILERLASDSDDNYRIIYM
jgi:hypothetical protein